MHAVTRYAPALVLRLDKYSPVYQGPYLIPHDLIRETPPTAVVVARESYRRYADLMRAYAGLGVLRAVFLVGQVAYARCWAEAHRAASVQLSPA